MIRPLADSSRSERLTDSSWFWLALFGLVAMIALVAVQGKFAQRQARLEQRYQDRLIAQQQRAKGAQPPPADALPVEPGYEEEVELPIAVSMAEARATTSLLPLVAVAGVIMLVGIGGLLWRRGSGSSQRTDGGAESSQVSESSRRHRS